MRAQTDSGSNDTLPRDPRDAQVDQSARRRGY
jgi:hypothetical protein